MEGKRDATAFRMDWRADLAKGPGGKDYTQKYMVEMVFPSIWEFMKEQGGRLGLDVEGIHFPPWSEKMCPEIRWELPPSIAQTFLGAKPGETRFIRNPTLAPIQILGVLVGFFGTILLLWGIFFAAKKTALEARKHWCRSMYWPMALFWFSCMNWTSLFAHNVFEPDTPSWTVALSLDVIATGLSASNIIAGCVGVSHPNRNPKGKHASRSDVALFNVALMAVTYVVFSPRKTENGFAHPFPWSSEICYLLPVAVSAICAVRAFLNVYSASSALEKTAIALLVLGGGMLVAAPLSGVALCWGCGDLSFGVAHLAFLGCDVACIGTYRCLPET